MSSNLAQLMNWKKLLSTNANNWKRILFEREFRLLIEDVWAVGETKWQKGF